METNSLLIALGLLLFGGGEDNATQCHVFDKDIQGTYTGKCKNGLAEGYGVSIGKDKYEGYFHKGELSGKGKYSWGKGQWEGDIYEGGWKNGLMHGTGKYTYASGDIYEGNLKNSKRNGKGKYISANGSKYIGHYKDDEKNGYGKLTLQKGNKIIDKLQLENTGYWQGDVYIVQGIFKDGTLEIACSSPKDCKQKGAK